jgi:hypothetical protein
MVRVARSAALPAWLSSCRVASGAVRRAAPAQALQRRRQAAEGSGVPGVQGGRQGCGGPLFGGSCPRRCGVSETIRVVRPGPSESLEFIRLY